MTACRSSLWGVTAAMLLVWLAGCASPASRVVLLPQTQASAVEVRGAQGTQVLDKPYQLAAVSRQGEVAVDTTTAEKVREQFPQLLVRQPAAEQRFVLYFETGGAQLTAESEARLADVLTSAASRPGGEIVVTGHTDRVGALEANDALSLQRATAIRTLLLQRGFAPPLVEAVGRGEREPLVPTEDEVAEPRNRRAEVVVR
jgi:OmpA-OmpF porin, OOP family